MRLAIFGSLVKECREMSSFRTNSYGRMLSVCQCFLAFVIHSFLKDAQLICCYRKSGTKHLFFTFCMHTFCMHTNMKKQDYCYSFVDTNLACTRRFAERNKTSFSCIIFTCLTLFFSGVMQLAIIVRFVKECREKILNPGQKKELHSYVRRECI